MISYGYQFLEMIIVIDRNIKIHEKSILIWYSRTIINKLSDKNKINFRKSEVNSKKWMSTQLHLKFNLIYIYLYSKRWRTPRVHYQYRFCKRRDWDQKFKFNNKPRFRLKRNSVVIKAHLPTFCMYWNNVSIFNKHQNTYSRKFLEACHTKVTP